MVASSWTRELHYLRRGRCLSRRQWVGVMSPVQHGSSEHAKEDAFLGNVSPRLRATRRTQQAADDIPPHSQAPSPEPDSPQQGTIGVATEAESAPTPVLDLTDASRPMIIDLVRPAVAPPDVLVDDVWTSQPLGAVGLLAARRWQLAVKRLLDIVGSLGLLILLSPMMLVIAVVIPLTSPGPVIYAQRRIGKGGHPFTMYKFRSMERDAHELRHLHAHRNRHTTGPVFKVPDDPRVTRVGRVIRRLSLDELPQLLNVLRGDMSLVGPRPALPEEFDLCNAGGSTAHARGARTHVHLAGQWSIGRGLPPVGRHGSRVHPDVDAAPRSAALAPHDPGCVPRQRSVLRHVMAQVTDRRRPDARARAETDTVFILGPARSGTTLLYKGLCLHPRSPSSRTGAPASLGSPRSLR